MADSQTILDNTNENPFLFYFSCSCCVVFHQSLPSIFLFSFFLLFILPFSFTAFFVSKAKNCQNYFVNVSIVCQDLLF